MNYRCFRFGAGIIWMFLVPQFSLGFALDENEAMIPEDHPIRNKANYIGGNPWDLDGINTKVEEAKHREDKLRGQLKGVDERRSSLGMKSFRTLTESLKYRWLQREEDILKKKLKVARAEHAVAKLEKELRLLDRKQVNAGLQYERATSSLRDLQRAVAFGKVKQWNNSRVKYHLNNIDTEMKQAPERWDEAQTKINEVNGKLKEARAAHQAAIKAAQSLPRKVITGASNVLRSPWTRKNRYGGIKLVDSRRGTKGPKNAFRGTSKSGGGTFNAAGGVAVIAVRQAPHLLEDVGAILLDKEFDPQTKLTSLSFGPKSTREELIRDSAIYYFWRSIVHKERAERWGLPDSVIQIIDNVTSIPKKGEAGVYFVSPAFTQLDEGRDFMADLLAYEDYFQVFMTVFQERGGLLGGFEQTSLLPEISLELDLTQEAHRNIEHLAGIEEEVEYLLSLFKNIHDRSPDFLNGLYVLGMTLEHSEELGFEETRGILRADHLDFLNEILVFSGVDNPERMKEEFLALLQALKVRPHFFEDTVDDARVLLDLQALHDSVRDLWDLLCGRSSLFDRISLEMEDLIAFLFDIRSRI